MSKKIKLVALAGVLLVFLAGIFAYSRLFSETLALKKIFKGSTVAIIENHQDILNAVKDLNESGLLGSAPKTLVNIDYHADLRRNNDHLEKTLIDEGNWINALVSNGTVDEIYWVLPDESKTDPAQKAWYWEQDPATGRTYFKSGPPEQTFFVDLESGKIYFDPVPEKRNLAPVSFHKLVLSELPKFSGNKEIILSLDADFFDPLDHLAKKDQTEKTLSKKLTGFANALVSAKIKPVLTGCSRSIEYTTKTHTLQLDGFFQKIKTNAIN